LAVLSEHREEKATAQAHIEASQREWSLGSVEKPVKATISKLEP
jgi:hypothetical protein